MSNNYKPGRSRQRTRELLSKIGNTTDRLYLEMQQDGRYDKKRQSYQSGNWRKLKGVLEPKKMRKDMCRQLGTGIIAHEPKFLEDRNTYLVNIVSMSEWEKDGQTMSRKVFTSGAAFGGSARYFRDCGFQKGDYVFFSGDVRGRNVAKQGEPANWKNEVVIDNLHLMYDHTNQQSAPSAPTSSDDLPF